jgi:hypothetical protein
MTPILHRVRVVTPPPDAEPDREWPDWLVALTCVLLLAVSAVTMAVVLTVAWRALMRVTS